MRTKKEYQFNSRDDITFNGEGQVYLSDPDYERASALTNKLIDILQADTSLERPAVVLYALSQVLVAAHHTLSAVAPGLDTIDTIATTARSMVD